MWAHCLLLALVHKDNYTTWDILQSDILANKICQGKIWSNSQDRDIYEV